MQVAKSLRLVYVHDTDPGGGHSSIACLQRYQVGSPCRALPAPATGLFLWSRQGSLSRQSMQSHVRRRSNSASWRAGCQQRSSAPATLQPQLQRLLQQLRGRSMTRPTALDRSWKPGRLTQPQQLVTSLLQLQQRELLMQLTQAWTASLLTKQRLSSPLQRRPSSPLLQQT